MSLPTAPTVISAVAGLEELWAETLGDARICIAILDGPVDLTHSSLIGANLTQIETHDSRAEVRGPAAEHGTHVASVIFGRHDGPVKGIAPHCRGLVLPVFKDGEDGSVLPCSQIDLARAITQAIQIAEEENAIALVINISGGQFTPSGQAHPILADVVRNCDKSKVLIVAAAGNQGCDCLHIPGAIPSVLAVGAMTLQGSPLDFSNWGENYREQGVLAPGENILGASPSGGTTAKSGTSFATAVVSGIAALLLSLQQKHSNAISAEGVRAEILQSALGCEHQQVADCRRLLAGRLHIPGATELLLRKGQLSMSENSELGKNMTNENVLPQGELPKVVENQPIQPTEAAFVASQGVTCSTVSTLQSEFVMPSDCGCGGKKSAPTAQKVYAIGKLSFDYGTRQRREYFRNRIGGDPDRDLNLIHFLTARPHVSVDYTILNGPQFANRTDVTSFTWVLKIDETPVYAISPMGAFAFETHDTLVAFLKSQLGKEPSDAAGNDRYVSGATYGEGVERMAVPGVIVGETRLFTGEQVPVLAPFHGGLANWTTDALLNAITAALPSTDSEQQMDPDPEAKVKDILDRMYELTRNLGISSHDRALNYAATDALQIQGALSDPDNQSKFAGLDLDTINVEKSPICRPDYDCWDAVVIFYDPTNLQKARRGIRYTIDVSDVMPQIVSGSQRVFTLR